MVSDRLGADGTCTVVRFVIIVDTTHWGRNADNDPFYLRNYLFAVIFTFLLDGLSIYIV